MPEAVPGHAVAIDALSALIAVAWPQAEPIDPAQLKPRFPTRSFVAGWRLPAHSTRADEDLFVLCDRLYPYSLPRIALAKAPAPATYPHVESDGVLCLVAPHERVELPADPARLEGLLEAAGALLAASKTGSNRSDFIDEIATYWLLQAPDSVPLWICTELSGQSSVLSAVRLANAWLLGADSASTLRWARQFAPEATAIEVETALHVALAEPLFPDQYPSNSAELVALVHAAGESTVDALAQALRPGSTLPVVFSFEHGGLRHYVGAAITCPRKVRADAMRSIPITRGFRPNGPLPALTMMNRVAAARLDIQRNCVTPVYASALQHRTIGDRAERLRRCKVAISGCGALGSAVALQLAQSGVRHMVLIDPDTHQWANVGRSQLSGRQVGNPKSEALRGDLLSRFPDYEVEAVVADWQTARHVNPLIFDDCDLVISLIGSWQQEVLLNNLVCDGAVAAALFGWTEAQGLAGHALAVVPPRGCMRCLCDASGDFALAVSDVTPRHGLQREHSCGAVFQPYGSVAVAPTVALITRLALDLLRGYTVRSELRSWIGAAEDFDAIDATLRAPWAERVLNGGWERVYRQPVEQHASCPTCMAGAH